jgi:monogalactosyldiacylglycerol synthase
VQDAAALAEALKNMMADGGAPWRLLHENLLKADMTGGSGKIADLALNLAAERTN